MTTPEFTFPVRDLDAGGKHIVQPVRAAWLRGVLEGTTIAPAGADGELDVRLSKSGDDVVVHGSVRADLTVPCSRCLEPATVSVREPLSALAVVGAEPQGRRGDEDEIDVEPDEADTIGFDGDTLVLDDLVRDELLLGIPMIPLCSDTCPGISTGPAEAGDSEPGIDPRLAPLLKLQPKT